MTAEVQNIITIYFGRKGSGKTTLARKHSKDIQRIIIADPMNQFAGGFIFYTFPEFRARFNELYERGNFRVICKFTRDEDFSEMFSHVFNYRNFTLLVDEIDMFASSRYIDENLKRIISYGRNYRINLMGTTRRPYEVNRTLTAMTDIIYSFRQTEPRDLEYMLKQYGISPERLKNLEKFEYVKFENS